MKKLVVLITVIGMTFATSAGSQNSATCYSSYETKLFGIGGYTIWVCGSCTSVDHVKSAWDSGTCTFGGAEQ